MTDYRELLASRAVAQRVAPGESSYFTAPTPDLDPNLFAGDRMRPAVRSWLHATIHAELERLGYRGSEHWLRIWVAGSGASYQWSAARDPGDLDVLLGIDYVSFRQANPIRAGLSDVEISDEMDEKLSAGLWKRTANQQIGSATYEVTWYSNPGSSDIRSIHPYAAFDVDRNDWTVRPIELPADGPASLFPADWAKHADADRAQAADIVRRYDAALAAHATASNMGARTNAATALAQASREGETLFDEIHLGRHKAFDAEGAGYADWHNYRWQAGKRSGVIPALRAIHDAARDARADADMALYGRKIESNEHTRTEALLAGRVQRRV